MLKKSDVLDENYTQKGDLDIMYFLLYQETQLKLLYFLFARL